MTYYIAYMVYSLVLLVSFKFIYPIFTPQNEWKLIKENNTTAGVAFGGAIIGFCIALAGAAENSIHLLDFIVWGAIAMGTQGVSFIMLRLIFMPKIASRVQNDEIAAGCVLAATNIGIGILSNACMTY